MSANFRAVRVEWGESTAQFLGQANVMCVLESIAEKAETAAEAGTAGNELEEFWVEDGSRFLDTLQSSTQEEFQYWLDLGPEAGSDLEALFDNMQALTETWRQQIDSNGNLRLWLDRRVDGPT